MRRYYVIGQILIYYKRKKTKWIFHKNKIKVPKYIFTKDLIQSEIFP